MQIHDILGLGLLLIYECKSLIIQMKKLTSGEGKCWQKLTAY